MSACERSFAKNYRGGRMIVPPDSAWKNGTRSAYKQTLKKPRVTSRGVGRRGRVFGRDLSGFQLLRANRLRLPTDDKVANELGIELQLAFQILHPVRANAEMPDGVVAIAHIAAARAAAVTDREIHDVVLIAAAFSMFNRYVDGLATWTPQGHDIYDQMGRRMAALGYAAHLPRP